MRTLTWTGTIDDTKLSNLSDNIAEGATASPRDAFTAALADAKLANKTAGSLMNYVCDAAGIKVKVLFDQIAEAFSFVAVKADGTAENAPFLTVVPGAVSYGFGE
jgi:hypothetical protein